MMNDPYSYQRSQMIDTLRASGISDERVLAVMAEIPRHEFVPREYFSQAYSTEVSLSIGEGQTISQPRVVARMSEAARLSPDDIVLEVGTGSGYQAAVLSRLVRFVFTVERHASLARTAKARLDAFGIENVSVKVMDGSLGWRAQGPYKAILVTAAAPNISDVLYDQLIEGGRLIVPVGSRDEQVLTVVEKRGPMRRVTELEEACFVPLIGRRGWEVQ